MSSLREENENAVDLIVLLLKILFVWYNFSVIAYYAVKILTLKSLSAYAYELKLW